MASHLRTGSCEAGSEASTADTEREGRKLKKKWTHDDIPNQTGRIAIVTGANTGIGYETARALARKGADVTLACRSREKGEAAAARIAAEQPRGRVAFAALDLADL